MMSTPIATAPVSPTPVVTRIAWTLLAIYIFVLPIGHTTALRNLLFFFLIMITFWLAWCGKLRLSIPMIKPWLLYAAIACISLVYAIDPWYSLGEIKTEIGYGLLAMLLGASWINTPERFSRLVWIIIASNALLIAYSFYYAFPLLVQHRHIEVGSLNIGVGKFSTYLVLVLPLIVACWLQLSKQQVALRVLLGILIAGNIAAVYFTGNRAGLLALFVEVVCLSAILLKYCPSLRSSAKTWTAVALAVIILSTLGTKQFGNRDPAPNTSVSAAVSGDSRWAVWRHALGNIESRPFSGGGFGLDAFKLRNPGFPKNNPANNPQLWHAHNTLLNIGVQTGLPGIVAFIILIVAALHRISTPLRQEREWTSSRLYSAAAVLMFAGLAAKLQTDDFFSRDIALLFWLIVGALLSSQASFCRHGESGK